MARDWAATIGPWLAIVVVVAGVVMRFAALEEFRERAVEEMAQQNRAHGALADRVRTLETSRTIEQSITELTAKVAALEAEMRAMRDDLRRRRR